jgi:hypothetical protein
MKARLTLMTCSVLFAVAAPARAEELMLEPMVSESTPPLSYRHFVGMEVGSTSPLALVYRYRLFAPLFVEVGGFGAPEALALFTGGILVAFHQSDRLMVYSGVGAGACVIGDTALDYLYGRVGLGVKLGSSRRQMLSADVGVWWGLHRKYDHDTGARTTDERFTIPMAGVSYGVGFGL